MFEAAKSTKNKKGLILPETESVAYLFSFIYIYYKIES